MSKTRNRVLAKWLAQAVVIAAAATTGITLDANLVIPVTTAIVTVGASIIEHLLERRESRKGST